MTVAAPYPKIELHVHLEGAVSPELLLAAARRNGFTLPVATVEELREFMRFRDFDHFIESWFATTPALQTERDYRELVLDYARRAQARGAVYLEAIFSPTDKLTAGIAMETVFEGFCDGAAAAREQLGLEVRLTPDITRGVDLDVAKQTARLAVAYKERGVVALGLGGAEAQFPPEPYAEAFAIARAGGVGSVPHAGEVAGPASIRGALETLAPDRIRHGVRAVEDPGLLRELADRGMVLDVCVLSNVCLGVVARVEDHPLPQLIAAGVPVTVNTDDPTFFACELDDEHAAARSLGADPRALFDAGVAGALCEPAVKERLRALGDAHDWDGAGRPSRPGVA
ncbi:MAG TPA: adenosine deaminase [Conexibacter sp.]|nr:adenosine deaminase [Conexibacter sp.]